VGGNTKGKVTAAPMGTRHLDWVCESHHAKGVATPSKTSVVKLANLSVSPMACQASSVITESIQGQ
jgi:hypothetical protein